MISGHKNVIVSCLYRTPGTNTNDFSEILYDLFSELSVSKSIFICGDFNLDILKHNSNHATKYFLDTMYSLGLYPLIDRPSRITNHSSTLIDNILTTNLAAVVCVCAKFDHFLPVRSYFESIRPENFVRITKFPYAAFGPLFAFQSFIFTRNVDLECKSSRFAVVVSPHCGR